MDEFEQNARIHAERTQARTADIAAKSKQRLQEIAEKKIRTTFIGSLSEFEKTFGFLWGREHTSDEQIQILKVLEEQGYDIEYFRKMWDVARTNILNNGNNQMRGLNQEIDQYSMTWDRYRLVLPVRKENS